MNIRLPPIPHLHTTATPQHTAPARDAAAQHHAAAGAIRFTPPALFNQTANVTRREPYNQVPFAVRRARTQSRDMVEQRSSRMGAQDASSVSGYASTDDEEIVFRPRVALERLRTDDTPMQQRQLDEELEQLGFDELQRFNLYLEAAREVDGMELSREESRRLKIALKTMMTEIFSKNRHQMRRLMHDADELEAAITAILGTQSADAADATRRGLRSLFAPGPRVSRDKVDVPLKALSVLRFLIRSAGPEACMQMLPAIRAQWKSEY